MSLLTRSPSLVVSCCRLAPCMHVLTALSSIFPPDAFSQAASQIGTALNAKGFGCCQGYVEGERSQGQTICTQGALRWDRGGPNGRRKQRPRFVLVILNRLNTFSETIAQFLKTQNTKLKKANHFVKSTQMSFKMKHCIQTHVLSSQNGFFPPKR